MNGNIQTLQYHPTVEIRTMVQDGEVWWVLADVCQVLGIANPRNVTARLDDDEKDVRLMDTLGGPQEMTVINESGLYSVILRSDKPEAKAFKHWVTHEVLPSIRRTGAYSVGGASQTSGIAAICGAVSLPCSATAKLLLLKLLELDRVRGGTGIVQISNPDVARLLGVRSRHTIAAARKELIAEGAIEYTAGNRAGPSTYRLKST